jgi:hypothetical protein
MLSREAINTNLKVFGLTWPALKPTIYHYATDAFLQKESLNSDATVVVINFSNINKANNHLSPKESLNSDGQQFHQYQQNKKPLLILTEHKKDHHI